MRRLRTTRSGGENVEKENLCFFCGQPGSGSSLRHVGTFALEARVRECANYVQDHALIAKLSAGDTIVTEAKYHETCLSALYKMDASACKQESNRSQIAEILARAIAELLSYVGLQLEEVEIAPVFRLCDVINLYEERFRLLEGDPKSIHATDVKEKIQNYFSKLNI